VEIKNEDYSKIVENIVPSSGLNFVISKAFRVRSLLHNKSKKTIAKTISI